MSLVKCPFILAYYESLTHSIFFRSKKAPAKKEAECKVKEIILFCTRNSHGKISRIYFYCV